MCIDWFGLFYMYGSVGIQCKYIRRDGCDSYAMLMMMVMLMKMMRLLDFSLNEKCRVWYMFDYSLLHYNTNWNRCESLTIGTLPTPSIAEFQNVEYALILSLCCTVLCLKKKILSYYFNRGIGPDCWLSLDFFQSFVLCHLCQLERTQNFKAQKHT